MSPGDLKKRGLGRGLSSLFNEEREAPAEPVRGLRTVPIEHIKPGRSQPRQIFDEEAMAGLAQSIRDKGVLQPLLVRVHPDLSSTYELIAGERRWRAAQRAGLHEVPVLVRDLGDRDALEIALVENLQREDLNPLEEADAYQRLIAEFQHTQEELAQVVGKSRSHVTNTLRLLTGSDKIRRYLRDGKLSAGHARALLGAPDADMLADQVLETHLSVRETEALVARARQPATPKKSAARDADVQALERDLAETLGLAVTLKSQGQSGALTIRYRTLDQLDQLLKRLR